MTYVAFISAVLALLLAPGPTNTLMGVAGARSGMRGILRLLPAEMLGYLTTILPLVWIGAEVLQRWPITAVALKCIAAAWVMFLAIRLWGMHATAAGQGEVTPHRIYVTTMLNPKALIFGLVLLPTLADPHFLPKLGMFCVMVSSIAALWGMAGTLTQVGAGGGDRLKLVQRAASLWLAIVSVTLIVGVIRA